MVGPKFLESHFAYKAQKTMFCFLFLSDLITILIGSQPVVGNRRGVRPVAGSFPVVRPQKVTFSLE